MVLFQDQHILIMEESNSSEIQLHADLELPLITIIGYFMGLMKTAGKPTLLLLPEN